MPTQLSAISQIVESVFETMLGLPLIESPAMWTPGPNRLTSSVHLSGEWNGALLVECTLPQACAFAARFLSMDPVGEVDDVVRDVLGELANMIGGNLKSILGRGMHLSMPSVVDGSYNWRVCGAEAVERLAFDSAEGTLWIMVLTSAA